MGHIPGQKFDAWQRGPFNNPNPGQPFDPNDPQNVLFSQGGLAQGREVEMLGGFNRKDRGTLGFTELLLSRQQGLEQLISGFKNPFTQQIAGSLDEATQRVRGLRGQFDTIGDDLRNSALARTQGAQVAALNAARQTSGRGGTAFGGGSSGIATRAAREAASSQSAGLAQALLQGRQMKGQFDLQQSGMETQLAGMMSNARSKQAALAEAQIGRQVGARTGFMEMLTSIAGIGGNKQSAEQRKQGTSLGLLGNFKF